jgi:hypothetical protein
MEEYINCCACKMQSHSSRLLVMANGDLICWSCVSRMFAIDVQCPYCKAWVGIDEMPTRKYWNVSTTYRVTYMCPVCRRDVGVTHGGDPAWGVKPYDFTENAVREATGPQQWARFAVPYARNFFANSNSHQE